MSEAAIALQAGLFARLSGDAALAALLGGERIYDAPPRGAATPYVAVGGWTARPVDGLEAPTVEHRFTLRVVSREGGRREAGLIADRIAALLEASPPAPDGHRLVGLSLAETTTGEGRDRRSFEAALAFRAVTEPAG